MRLGVEVRPDTPRGPLVHLDLGWIDGGDHGRDIRDWRNITPDEAIELGRDLMLAGLRARAMR